MKSDRTQMVSIERLRTHVDFDGLGDMLGALDVQIVPRKVEGRQCPDGGYGRCSMDGARVRETYKQV